MKGTSWVFLLLLIAAVFYAALMLNKIPILTLGSTKKIKAIVIEKHTVQSPFKRFEMLKVAFRVKDSLFITKTKVYNKILGIEAGDLVEMKYAVNDPSKIKITTVYHAIKAPQAFEILHFKENKTKHIRFLKKLAEIKITQPGGKESVQYYEYQSNQDTINLFPLRFQQFSTTPVPIFQFKFDAANSTWVELGTNEIYR